MLSNLLGVCRRCHNRIHHSMKHSLNLGWLVQSWADPAGKPVRLYEGWVVLGDDGSTVIDEAPSL